LVFFLYYRQNKIQIIKNYYIIWRGNFFSKNLRNYTNWRNCINIEKRRQSATITLGFSISKDT